jgi:hypothetical protein
MTMQTVAITVLPTTAPRGVRVVVAGDLDIATTEQLHTELDAVLTHRPVFSRRGGAGGWPGGGPAR